MKSGTTTPPEEIADALDALFSEYELQSEVSLQEILELHVRFEQIRPFEDANGRIGRLLMLKECLRHDVVPFILDDKHRTNYLTGVRCWVENNTTLLQLCATLQVHFNGQLELGELLERHN